MLKRKDIPQVNTYSSNLSLTGQQDLKSEFLSLQHLLYHLAILLHT